MKPGTVTEDQYEVVRFLSDPSTHGGMPVEVIETHSATVFLAGDRAIKLKRAVWFPFLDFSTLEKRRDFCRAEVALNRRTAPSLYFGALPVTREPDGRLALDGAGNPLDWVVVMQRFDQAGLFSHMAERGALDVPLMERLADAIARFHAIAERRIEVDFAAGIGAVIDGNTQSLRNWSPSIFEVGGIDTLDGATRSLFEETRNTLTERSSSGFVRRCHGDLHLGNICMIDGEPTLFDCIEFSDHLAVIDVFYDLAFLMMDLEEAGMRRLTNAVLNRYLARTADYGGVSLLPLFMSCRAAIRAHVTAAGAERMHDSKQAEDARRTARTYLHLAGELTRKTDPLLVAIGGLSGSGKSTIAQTVAPGIGPAPGAVVLRTDVVRKTLFGVDLFERLPQDAYSADANRRVYERFLTLARDCLRSGSSVIADGVFLNAEDRQTIRQTAEEAGVRFVGLWLNVTPETQRRRIEGRRRDASDATVDVAVRQRTLLQEPVDWPSIDADGPVEAICDAVLRSLDASR